VTQRWNDNQDTSTTIDFDKWTDATTFSADYTLQTFSSLAMLPRMVPLWLRIRDDGTNISVWRSTDGQHFIQIGANQLRGDFITGGPTQVGFFAYNNTRRIALAILSWVSTSP